MGSKKMAVGTKFIFYMVELAKFLVVFLKFRKVLDEASQFLKARGHPLFTGTFAKTSDECLISSTHEVSVSSDLLDLSITFIFLLSFLINLKQFLLPFNFHEVK